MDKPCEKCGHPGPFIPGKGKINPDPREGLSFLCTACGKDITYDSHQWNHSPDGRWVCCSCMAPTRALRDLAQK